MILRIIYKLIGMFLIISSISIVACVHMVIAGFSIHKSRKKLIENVSKHLKLATKLLGIKINCINFKENPNGTLYVCNHHSSIDIYILTSIVPFCFITSYEMKEAPFLGQLCTLGGCLFVERRSKKGISSEIKNIAQALRNHFNIMIFPEATTANGDALLKFRRPLFQAAIDAKVSVRPVCMNYTKINGEKLSTINRDHLFWYGEMSFVTHFLRVCALKSIEVDVHFLETLKVGEHTTKEELAILSFNQISEVFRPLT